MSRPARTLDLSYPVCFAAVSDIMPPLPTRLELPGLGPALATTLVDSDTGAIKAHCLGGIPYARPLDPAQRFRRAQPLPADHRYGTADAPADFTGVANVCPQVIDDAFPPRGHMSEDCLQLNVWVPAEAPPSEGWPVMFYIRTSPRRFPQRASCCSYTIRTQRWHGSLGPV